MDTSKWRVLQNAQSENSYEHWNAGAKFIFGYRSAEATGQALDTIIPEELRARDWEGYGKVMMSGSTRYGRQLPAVPAKRKDGTRISIEFSIIFMRSPGGELLDPAAIIRGVTAR